MFRRTYLPAEKSLSSVSSAYDPLHPRSTSVASAVLLIDLTTIRSPRTVGQIICCLYCATRCSKSGSSATFGNHSRSTALNPLSSARSRNSCNAGSSPGIVIASDESGLLERSGSLCVRMTETGRASTYALARAFQPPVPRSDVDAPVTLRLSGESERNILRVLADTTSADAFLPSGVASAMERSVPINEETAPGTPPTSFAEK